MGTSRRQFTDEFKRESVGLLASSGRSLSQIARELGIATSMLRSWRDAGADLAAENARLRRENERLRMEREILKKNAAHLLGSAEMKFRLIEDQRERFPVRVVCDVMGVSPAGYYAWRGRPESPRKMANRALLTEIRRVHTTHRGRYGAPRIHAALRADGQTASRSRVERLMHHYGIRARTPRRFRVRTTDSHHDLPIAPNRLDQKFAAGQPNQVWLADITYVPTEEGWLYLAVVLDLFTRKIVGWAMRDHMRAELTIAALTMAIQRQKPPSGLTHHSDRGRQYAAAAQGSRRSRDDPIHEPEGKLLGQCTDGKLLRHSENRTRAPGLLPNPGCRPTRLVRLHRRILQSSAAPFRPRVYHPRTGRAPSRLIQCPLNRRKVRNQPSDSVIASGL